MFKRKRRYDVFIENRAGEKIWYADSWAVSVAKAENNGRHRYCSDKFGKDVSVNDLWTAEGIRFVAERVGYRAPAMSQPLLFNLW